MSAPPTRETAGPQAGFFYLVSNPARTPPMSAKSTGLRVLALLACFLMTAPVVAQELIPGTTVATKRTQALNLSDRGRHPEALPMLEELTQVLPNDALVWERYAMALLSSAATLPDLEARKLMRVRAKQAFTRTRDLGNNTPLAMLGNAIPPDGGEPPLASSAEAQSAMQTAEAAFARGDFA